MDFGGCCKLRVHVNMFAPLHVCVADMYDGLLPLATFDSVPFVSLLSCTAAIFKTQESVTADHFRSRLYPATAGRLTQWQVDPGHIAYQKNLDSRGWEEKCTVCIHWNC